MITLHLLLVEEIKPEVLIEIILVVRMDILVLTVFILCGVHLDLHCLLASSGVRDEVLLEFGWA